ncbi:MAG: protoporphyrinogen oxidase [Melioribacteraceae bacterium]|nr:protoporphyrinogen oxidase [Melioribacteraceae bacterium]
MKKKVVILGAGISGLTTAYWLFKDGFDVTILEDRKEPGGSMQTRFEEGFLTDLGPNSGLETTPLIKQIVDEVGLTDKMIYASDSSNKRYILRNGQLHALPTSLPVFLSTKLFSLKGKLRLFAEPFIGKSDDGYYQSIAQFVTRRLGTEFFDYAIDPFVSGVFAGDPHKLSVKSAFPKLYRLEELYGGLVKGMFKGARERKKRNEKSKQSAKMFSFIDGMQSFPTAIAEKLKDKIHFESEVKSVERRDEKWIINYEHNNEVKEINADIVISTLPAVNVADVFGALDSELKNHLNQIYYPPVMVLYLGFKKSAVGQTLDGFGYLIPSKEKKTYLGAIWSSVIFPNRCSEENAAFTIFIGGARMSHLFEMQKDELIGKVISEFKSQMKISDNPIFLKEHLWHKAIPQYNLGYIEHENYFDKFEKEHPGLFVSGNFRGGISVGDCVKNSEIVFNKVKSFVTV